MAEEELVKSLKADVKQGNPQSCRELAEIYYNGTHGVFQNYRKAAKLFLVAAKDGHFPAQFHLGVMYQKGQGVPQNYILAHMWMNLATRLGDKNWENIREGMGKLLTPEQIERAQDMAVEWLEKNPKAANDPE